MTATTTTPATSRRVKTRRKRSRVEHYWWISDGDAARSLGIFEVPAICGRAWIALPDADEVKVTVRRTKDGTLTYNGSADACKVCERMLLADVRRVLKDRDRGRS